MTVCSASGHTDDTAPSVLPATWASHPPRWCVVPRTTSITCNASRAPFVPANWTPATNSTWWKTGNWCASPIMRRPRRRDCTLTAPLTVTNQINDRGRRSRLSNWKRSKLPTIIVRNRRDMFESSCHRTRDWTCEWFRCGFKTGTWVICSWVGSIGDWHSVWWLCFTGERKKSDWKKTPGERDGASTLGRWRVAVRRDATTSCWTKTSWKSI